MAAWVRSRSWTDFPWLRLIAIGVLLISITFTYAGLNGPPCLWRTLLHTPCPGCGLTRSIRALWHGDLLQSFRFHPLGLPLVVVCAAALIPWPPSLKKRMSPSVSLWLTGTFAVLLVGLWLLRLGLERSGNHFFEW